MSAKTHHIVDDCPWQLSPGISFVSEVLVVNSMSVVHKGG